MTSDAPPSSPAAIPAGSQVHAAPAMGSGRPRLRALVWGLHVVVSLLAVLSLATHRFDLWIDLRILGPTGTLVLEILWAATTLLVPLCAGPRLGGYLPGAGPPHWTEAGFAPEWARRFLWPTYLMLALLLANTVYYFDLVWHIRAEKAVPAPLFVAVVLGAWAILTREWMRSASRPSVPITSGAPSPSPPPPTVPTRRRTLILAGLFAATMALLGTASFCIHCYAHPPQHPVDLAVVLGYGVNPDGTASARLADRTRAAINLYQRGLINHILLSGAVDPPAEPGGHELNEVAAMRQVCLDAGIPEYALSLDPVGVNTRASAYNTRDFMRRHGYTTLVICTSDFHLFRSDLAFRQVGLQPATVAAQPSLWPCADPFFTARELLGIAVYWLSPTYRLPKAATMTLTAPRIVVKKTAGTLELFDGPSLIKTYACITGGNAGDKSVEGDRKTPIGTFHIIYKNPLSKYHLSLGLDYPNKDDADRGLAAGLITRQQYEGILEALTSDLTREENQKKLWYTPLGGEIFIHGFGTGRTATAGCVALANEDIDELYAWVPLGTPVEIRP